MSPSVAFLLCVERGFLEDQALLLVRSIRRYGGRFRQTPVYAFQPRVGSAVTDHTSGLLRELGAVHVTERLNARFADYPIANKIFAAAWAETTLDADILVFLDSDTFFAREPTALTLPAGRDAAVRPVSRARWASTGPGDPNEAYWLDLYRICGIPARPMVRTAVEGVPVRAYFNSGLVAVRRVAGLFRQWQADFLRLVAHEHLPSDRSWQFMDQMALAATLGRVFDRVLVLDPTYNYPLPARPRLPSELATLQLDDLVHVHYHSLFRDADALRRLSPPVDLERDVPSWLAQFLPLRDDRPR